MKVALHKHAIKFDRKGKPTLRFVRPYNVLEYVGKVAN